MLAKPSRQRVTLELQFTPQLAITRQLFRTQTFGLPLRMFLIHFTAQPDGGDLVVVQHLRPGTQAVGQ